MDANTLQQIQRIVSEGLAAAFRTQEHVLAQAINASEEEIDRQEVDRVVRQVLSAALAARHIEMASWPAITDCDRLDAAFEELNAQGIMARHNWWCCGNCGAAAMPAEVDRLGGSFEGRPIVGYTFYHSQDTEAAVRGYGLGLAYGSTEGAPNEAACEEQCLGIARRVCDALTKHGLGVDWDGTYAKRIGVTLKWQRRTRPARFFQSS